MENSIIIANQNGEEFKKAIGKQKNIKRRWIKH